MRCAAWRAHRSGDDARPGRFRRLRSARSIALPAAALFAAALEVGCGAAAVPPDVVLITLDTTRLDHVGAYGRATGATPNLDRLAAEAVRFDRAWSTSPWTLPSHASLLTARYPSRHGADYRRAGEAVGLGDVVEGVDDRFEANALRDGEVTLAELLSAKGFATGAFVAGPWLAPPFGLLQGYDVQDADVEAVRGRSAAEITDAAIAWIRGVPRDRPLHLLANYFDPHAPYAPPEAFRPTGGASGRKPSARERYAAEIRYMDAQIGRLLDALRDTGRYDGAMIVVVSDHGELFGEHGLQRHGFYLYEELVRVPLLVRHPNGREGGTVDESVVSVADVLPMVAAEVGLELPADVDGVAPGERRIAIAEFRRNPSIDDVRGRRVDRDLVAVVEWPWKIVRATDGTEELFRLDDDPGERTNLLGRESVAAAERALRARLGDARAKLAGGAPDARPAIASEKLRERLRALGYLD